MASVRRYVVSADRYVELWLFVLSFARLAWIVNIKGRGVGLAVQSPPPPPPLRGPELQTAIATPTSHTSPPLT